jgi:response regulator of citrate/malate metabolism
MINAIIVDDEPLAQDVLETYIEKIPEITLLGKCNNAIEANEMLKKEDVDLMFLDIQMPQLTGIDFSNAFQASNSHFHYSLSQLCD